MFDIFRKQSNIGLGLILWALLATSLWAGWRSEVIYTGSNQIFNFAIGNGRNDGKPRIYAYMANLGLVELGYLGGGQWSFDIIDILPSSQSMVGPSQTNDGNLPQSLTIGPGRNDGVNRIYLCPWGSDSLYEFTYSNEDWVKRSERILEDPSTLLSLKIAQARNDDTFRIYCCNRLGRYSPDTLYELTWRNEGWDIYRIPVESGYFTIGKGRNDDTVRLYKEGWPSPLELTYRGGWCIDTMFSVPPVFWSILMAEGHNDGLNRLYGQSLTGDPMFSNTLTFYEIAYHHGKWETEIIEQIVSEEPLGYNPLMAGDGRNDDTIRLYLGYTEYSYRESLWVKELIDPFPGVHYIGKGRGDDTNRIYGYRDSIIELTYSPEAIGEDRGIPYKMIEELIITLTPSFESVKIQYMVQEGLISLRIYDTMGRLVRKLVEGDRRQGKYSIYWNGKDDKGNDVGEGIFFCQLKSGGNSLSKKLIRIK